MKLSELPIHRVKRVISKEEATTLVGTVVSDMEANITEAGIYIDDETDEPFLEYFPMEQEFNLLRRSLLNVEYIATQRVALGMKNVSRTFGMAPRKIFESRNSC
jgi:hypothetical protein